MKTQHLEIELRDRNGNLCLTEEQDLSSSLLEQVRTQLEEKIGGMLCIEHIHLPISQKEFSGRRWVIKVACCCSQQSKAVEARLYEHFK